MSGIKSMHVDSSAYVRLKGDESEWFRIDSGVRKRVLDIRQGRTAAQE